MRIVQLTPGAGGMYCGACMRDNALAAALRRLGHDVLLIPLYTPLTTDEPDNSHSRIFFGGINVFLQQKSPLFRITPEWMDKRLDDPQLLRLATRFGIKTTPSELGELTLSMLKGEDGYQAKELEKLCAWLSENCKPDVICLSNVLLSGLVRKLQSSFNAPVLCTMQGEDFFLDGLPETQRAASWDLLRNCAASIDGFIAVSRYYGDVMAKRLDVSAGRVHVVHNGIDFSSFAPPATPPERPVVGYLARMSPEKGLCTLIDAFKQLRSRDKAGDVRLRIGGSMTANDHEFVNEIQSKLRAENLLSHVELKPNLTREEKIAFLQSLSVFSVPAAYGESFGLYVLEALACGVPVVQPRHGAFPEILEATGGGILCAPSDSADLAEKLEELLLNPARARDLGHAGRERVLANFGIDRAASEISRLFEKAAGL